MISTAGIAKKGNRYLIFQRKLGGSLSEKWEFPGGKVEAGETPEEALAREIQEELAVSARIGTKIMEGEFSHSGKTYTLLAFEIHLVSENFILSDHQRFAWVSQEELSCYDFADSDKLIVSKIMHP